jgi:hypothetical protein
VGAVSGVRVAGVIGAFYAVIAGDGFASADAVRAEAGAFFIAERDIVARFVVVDGVAAAGSRVTGVVGAGIILAVFGNSCLTDSLRTVVSQSAGIAIGARAGVDVGDDIASSGGRIARSSLALIGIGAGLGDAVGAGSG